MKTYKYSCLSPKLDDIKLIRGILSERNIYQNKLIEIELKARTEYREIRLKYSPNLDTAQQNLDSLLQQQKELRNIIKIKRANQKCIIDPNLLEQKVKIENAIKNNPSASELILLKQQKKVVNSLIKKNRAESSSRLSCTEETEKIKFLKSQIKQAKEYVENTRLLFDNIIDEYNEKLEREIRNRHRKSRGLNTPNNPDEEKALKVPPRGEDGIEILKETIINEWLVDPLIPDAYKEVIKSKQEKNKAIKKARLPKQERRNLTPGTYRLVEAALAQAIKSGNDPKFHKFDGTGSIAVQQVKTQFEIAVLPENIWDSRAGRRKAYTKAKLLVNDLNGDEKWIELDVLLDRPLPNNIREVQLIIKRDGPWFKYYLHLVSSDPTTRSSGNGSVALDLGWCQMADGSRRVAMTWDGSKHIELRLPKWIIDKFEHANKLKGYSENYFNITKDELLRVKNQLPITMQNDIEFVHAWKSHQTLSNLVKKWINNTNINYKQLWNDWKDRCNLCNRVRHNLYKSGKKLNTLENPDVIYDWLNTKGITNITDQIIIYLEWWRRKNQHLYQIETGIRCSAIEARTDLYRCFARMLYINYNELLREDINLIEFSKKSLTEELSDDQWARSIKYQVAPSELFKTISDTGIHEIKKKSAYTSQRCPSCGFIHSENRKGRIFKCVSCTWTGDADQVGSLNIFDPDKLNVSEMRSHCIFEWSSKANKQAAARKQIISQECTNPTGVFEVAF